METRTGQKQKYHNPNKKPDWQQMLDNIIASLSLETDSSASQAKPTLLLHACCAPCSSYVIEYLSQYFQITIYYYNPNIHPETEYNRRLTELKNFLPKFPEAIKNNVKLVEAPYNPEDYFEATNVLQETELQKEEERGERCRRCYLLRMKQAKEYAEKNNFDYFTTTLSISPYKDAEKINTIGFQLTDNDTIFSNPQNTENKISSAEKCSFPEHKNHTKYLPADFKKKSGFLRSTQISKEYGLWRQDYCGCIYSKQNEEERRAKAALAKAEAKSSE